MDSVTRVCEIMISTNSPYTQSLRHKIVLYSYWRSSCSWRVRIALALKQIPFEYRAVNLLQGDHRSESYIKLNPSAMVPLLCISSASNSQLEFKLGQSIAIIEYLEEAFPKTLSLFPPGNDPLLRAKVREIVGIIASDIQPVQNLRILNQMPTQEEKDVWAQKWIRSGLQAVEIILSQTAGKYCVGDHVTIADVTLVPQLANAKRFHIDVEKEFPMIAKIDQELSKLPAFIDAHPSKQIDAPKI